MLVIKTVAQVYVIPQNQHSAVVAAIKPISDLLLTGHGYDHKTLAAMLRSSGRPGSEVAAKHIMELAAQPPEEME